MLFPQCQKEGHTHSNQHFAINTFQPLHHVFVFISIKGNKENTNLDNNILQLGWCSDLCDKVEGKWAMRRTIMV